MNQITKFYQDLDKAVRQGKKIPTMQSGQGAYLKVNGKKRLNLCSNNYLGLAGDEPLKKAAISAVKKYGVGTGSVRALSGTNILHLELEERLAKFKKAEGCIVLTGGYMANLAAIQTFIGKEDIVISDELNHASIIDAVRLSQVKNKFIYKHKDMGELEKRLQEADKLRQNSTVLIITDGVFSMDGDLAPLPEIVKLAKKYQALTMVDDAHGEGVLGHHGRGIVDHFKLEGQVDLDVGTLSKAFGVMGGFITGKKELIEYLRLKARQFLFSNGLSIPDTAALIESVKILEKSDTRVKKLWANAKYLKEKFSELGFDCGYSGTPITPVMIGDEEKAALFSSRLLELGVFATPIKFPMVAKGLARIRVMPSASHSKKDLDLGIKAFAKVGKDLGVIIQAYRY
ncbi:glycine C-acetyltransferase [Candidatus Daviesbacteria bacterium]|nr:glycine C-acetyltransferase [Candidatus Daviesbacteria bacterium]